MRLKAANITLQELPSLLDTQATADIEQLVLDGQGEVFPADIGLLFPRLRKLILQNGQLASKGEWPTSLEQLELQDCSFRRFPAALKKCPKLWSLRLSHCQLKRLSAGVTRLPLLNTLRLDGNALTSLPARLADCKSLRSLDLSNNRFKRPPRVLTRLKWLYELNLSHNPLTSVNALRQCDRLEVLSLEANELANWPKVLRTHPMLRQLRLAQQPISSFSTKDLPRQLRQLALADIPLKHIAHKDWPDSLNRLSLDADLAERFATHWLSIPGLEQLVELKEHPLSIFLDHSRLANIPQTYWSTLWLVWQGQKALTDLPLPERLYALQLPGAHWQKQVKDTLDLAVTIPATLPLFFSDTGLPKRHKELLEGRVLSAQVDRPFAFVLGPDMDRIPSRLPAYIISSAALLHQLEQKKERPFALIGTDEQCRKLTELLTHSLASQRQLGLSMLQQGGVPLNLVDFLIEKDLVKRLDEAGRGFLLDFGLPA